MEEVLYIASPRPEAFASITNAWIQIDSVPHIKTSPIQAWMVFHDDVASQSLSMYGSIVWSIFSVSH